MVLRGSQLRDSESNSSQSGGGVSSSASSAATSKRSSSQAESESDRRMSEDESRPWKSMKRAEAVLFLRAQQDTLTPEETADAMVFLQNQDTLARLLSPDPVIPVNSAVGTSFVCFDSIVHPVVGSRSSAQGSSRFPFA